MAYRDFIASRASGGLGGLLLALLMVGAPAAVGQDRSDTDSVTDEAGAARAAGSADRPMIRMSFDSHALARRYPELTVWLEPEDFSPALALFEAETSAEPHGGILLLADQGQSANAPLLEGLRQRLAAAGWGTLSMGVEEASPAVMAAIRQQAAAANPGAGTGLEEDDGVASVMIDVNDGTRKEMIDRYYLQHHARLTEGMAWLGEQGYGERVIVTVGWSAQLLYQSLLSGLPGVTRVVWIAPDFALAGDEDLIAPFSPVAVLDLHAREPASTRAAAFRRAGVERFQGSVVAISARPGGRDSAVLAGRIISWLK